MPGAGQPELSDDEQDSDIESNNGAEEASVSGRSSSSSGSDDDDESENMPWVLPGRDVKRRLLTKMQRVLTQYSTLATVLTSCVLARQADLFIRKPFQPRLCWPTETFAPCLRSHQWRSIISSMPPANASWVPMSWT